jgi:nucleotide-binding universal stress UspA family protein
MKRNQTGAAQNGGPAVRARVQVPAGQNRRQLQTILVPVDFSKPSVLAIRSASELASVAGATLCILHVLDQRFFVNDLDKALTGKSEDSARAHAKQDLARLAKSEVAPLVPTFLDVRQGKPYVEIVKAARERKVDLIVMPTLGLTGLKHAVLGSTAERVMRHAHCPVLVLRGSTGSAAPRKKNNRSSRL